MPRILPHPAKRSSSVSDKPRNGAEDTRTRILAVATKAFAEMGIENVSMRELTKLAGANVAAINYHFGSKEGLAEAIFEEMAPRLNNMRLRELEEVLQEAAAQSKRPSVSAIVDSFTRPYLDPAFSQEGRLLAQLVLKHRLSPSPMTQRIISRHFDPMARQYMRAFALACPDVDPDKFAWRYMFMTGAVVLAATDQNKGNRITALSEGRLDATQPDALAKELREFVEGGLRFDFESAKP
ncbi:TetR/AcrR family transcriptional regulator [Ottowia caeni]|uniref:TetR/AcrR family transcriptional regulator n=1 Tax=Ottowia caeni TaxID=2870339 RepID=UPI003D708484